jgi:phage/plasmid-associated DNA primase
MQLWLGELCIDLPDWVYTGGKKKGGGPSPELAQAESALLAITCEPEEGNDLSAGAIKKGTGGDRFFGRMCGQDGGSIDLTHKSIYMCNAIPNIPNVDKATKNRFGILPFLSTWTMDAPEDQSEQQRSRTFKMDLFFEQKLPDLAEAIFWIAVQYFPFYIREKLIPPPIVREYTAQHWRDNDPYESFVGERMVKVKVKPDEKMSERNSVTSSDLYPHFKQFFRAQYPQSQVPAAPQFRTQLIQRIGKQTERRWPGWIIRDAE